MTAEGISAGPFMRLRNHIFQSQQFLKYLSYEAHFSIIIIIVIKACKKSYFFIITFEMVALNSPYFYE